MRRGNEEISSDFRIAVLDDEMGVIDSISVVLKRLGYGYSGFISPEMAIEEIRKNHYDMLILDYLMDTMHGDEVVEQIRRFDKEIYILLLTGHKDLAPPLATIRSLEIQGYCEKSDKFDQLILLIESGIKSIKQLKRIKEFENGLNRILEAMPKIYQLRPVDQILEDVLKEILPLMGSRNAFILYDEGASFQPGTHGIFKGTGKYDIQADHFMSMIPSGLAAGIGLARDEKKVARLKEGLVFPLINELGKSMGVIYIETEESAGGVQLLDIYSKQAAASLSNAFLHSLVNIKNEELHWTYEELKTRYIDTIQVLRMAVDARDVYTRGHSDRVAYYAVKIGQRLGLMENELELLRLGGMFHDVGKIGTADDILFKTESLNDAEYNEIKRHTIKGANILSAVSMFQEVVPLIKYHHERIDGRGYPEGLKGNDIPLLARVLSVADAFDAMTSDRLYRSRLDLDEAVKQLTDASGTQFDEWVVKEFIQLLGGFEQMKKEIQHTFE